MPKVFVSIGSNMDREANIRGGVEKLGEVFGALQVSPVYECPAHGFNGSDFYNLAVGFDSGLALSALLAETKTLEQLFERQRDTERYAPRSLDIDVLLYGCLRDGRRGIPSPDLLNYPFVLKPMVDIAASLCHPVTGLTLGEHWNRFDKAGLSLREVPLDG